MSKKLTRVHSVPVEITATLRQHGVLTCKDFLLRNCLELMNLLDFSYPQLQSLTLEVCRAIAPRPRTVLSVYRDYREKGSGFLPTSLHKLDSALHGGLPSSTITEIAGPPGCGKTQFCLMLSLVAALPSSLGGLGRQVAYIDTEAAFTAERLVEMAKARYVGHFSSAENLLQLASSVHVFSETTCDSFSKRLETLDEVVVSKNIGLVVVDSIASLIRKEFDTRSSKGVAERASLLTKQASRLKYLAEAFKIPVVVTNQITTHVSRDLGRQCDWSDGMDEDLQGDGSVVTAALGNAWSHCVNTRLLLQYMQEGKRMLMIAKSPVSGRDGFVLSIEDKGLVLDWMATVELSSRQLLAHGDPASISLAVRSNTEGIGVAFPGQYLGDT